MPYISQREGSTEQQPGRDAEPPHSSELYPPELPCWQDQWLSKKKQKNRAIVTLTPVGTDIYRTNRCEEAN